MFAVSNTALLNFIMGSRLIYGMANQGLLPQKLAAVHKKRLTPHISILAVLGIMLLLSLSGDISSLARSTSVLLLTCFMVVNTALVILKLRPDEPKGKFEVHVLVPILGTLVCAVLLAHAQWPEIKTAGIILICIAALYFILKPKAELPSV
jgi:APA family basic amino acid/polyamine antiporter